tara:strand:+ start:26276 stop:26416 length:141 start_codon:yes stop_codon:yes gene_type:complete
LLVVLREGFGGACTDTFENVETGANLLSVEDEITTSTMLYLRNNEV